VDFHTGKVWALGKADCSGSSPPQKSLEVTRLSLELALDSDHHVKNQAGTARVPYSFPVTNETECKSCLKNQLTGVS
jgi:hypothetical protein